MGGAEISLYYLVNGLDRAKYKPLVLSPEPGLLVEKLNADKIPVQVVSLPAWRKLKSRLTRSVALRRLIEISGAEKAQLIHCNSIWVNPYAQAVGERLKIPVICHLRDIVTERHIRKYSLEKSDLIIAISHSAGEAAEKAGIKKLKIIYNGVDISTFSRGINTLKTEFSTSGYIIGIVSQLSPGSYHKGHREFLTAAAEVIKHISDVHFLIIGCDPSPESSPDHNSYISELKGIARKLGISDHIIFTGFRRDIPDVMASLDILVSASYSEGFGRTIAEAMAAGKPVVATAVGGVPEVVQDGVTGILVPPKDPHAIAKSILDMLQDDEMRLKMGIAGQKRAGELFSLKQNISQIQAIYESLLKKSVPLDQPF